VIESLPSKHDTLISNPNIAKKKKKRKEKVVSHPEQDGVRTRDRGPEGRV
jgi:hypothetical protein